MSGRVLIVGQGLAGTALGLELEAAGIDFAVASAGHAEAASRVAAGLINPVTGQRWVKSARVDELLPLARESYTSWGRRLGAELWHDLQLTRLYRDEAERTAVQAKIARGELAPWIARHDGHGALIAGAAWIDLPALLERAAMRWQGSGRLRARPVLAGDVSITAEGVGWGGEQYSAAVLCTGCGRLAREWFAHVPFTPAKGEMLSVRGCRLPAGQALNRGVWLIAGESGSARLGATYERGREDLGLTAAARDQLLSDAQELGAGDLDPVQQSAGVRLTLPDRLPVAGWHPHQSRLGILGGLGSKGSLWAPWLAKVWRENLADAMKRFPVEVSVERWLRGGDARAMRLSVEN